MVNISNGSFIFIDPWMDGQTDGLTDGQTDRQTYGWMDERKDWWTDEWMGKNVWMDELIGVLVDKNMVCGRMHIGMDGWINGWMDG